MPQKPRIIITQVDGSGTAPLVVVMLLKATQYSFVAGKLPLEIAPAIEVSNVPLCSRAGQINKAANG
jgi:hypothetical protein